MLTKYLDKIICGDCLLAMKSMPSETIDLVVTSPPYNLKNSTGNGMKSCTTSGKWAGAALQNGYSHHDDCMPHDKYVAWQRDCLAEMFRLIKNDGAIFYNHKWRVQGGLLQDRRDIVDAFPVRQIIIWRRKGGINFNPGYFLPTYEVIYIIAKPDFRLAPKANSYGDVWEFTQEMNNEHPAPFPVALIERIIGSTKAQIIFDPFMGSGTTAIAAKNLSRNYIGIELSPKYCELAERRLASEIHSSPYTTKDTFEAPLFCEESPMQTYSKNDFIDKFREISERGWIANARHGNAGGVGNTLEDLLGITENNLPIPNSGEWELKAQRLNTTSLTTLFHFEPSPQAIHFVPEILLLNYGWRHQESGKKYPENEMSFRQTIHGKSPSDRGFIVKIDRKDRKILISFDATTVDDRHKNWLKTVEEKIGLNELAPQPYWGFDDLAHKVGTKLLNCFYVQAAVRRENGCEFYHYCRVMMLQKFSFDGFLRELENGNILVDFDARTGHNHGTKFRMRQNCLPKLYEKSTVIIEK